MKKFYDVKQFGSKAEIRIYGDITKTIYEEGEVSASSFNQELSNLGNVSQVDIYFQSAGGSVFEGIAIYHQIKRHKAHFTGYVDGVAASIASVILMACDEIIMPSNAYLMIHNPFTGIIGNQNDLRKQADDLERIREASINAYLEKSGDKLSREKIIEIMDNETWLLGSEAFEYGLCDQLEKPMELVANAEIKEVLSQYKKAPLVLIDEVGQEERARIIKKNKIKKVDNKMEVFEFTKEQKMVRAKNFQDTIMYESLKKNGTASNVSYEMEHALKVEIAQSVVTGNKTYKQAMLATTGTVEGDGDYLIGKVNQTEVVTERLAYNPLLEYITLTTTKNLDDVPRLITAIDDDELIEDGDIAKELKATGKVVNFKRYQSKLFADMTETIARATNTDLTDKVRQSLASGLSLKEIKLMLGSGPKKEHEHMNFYKADLQEVKGENMYQAIVNSIKSLPYFFRANAIVVMKEDDFNSMRYDLANKGLCKLDSKAEELFNRPTVFIDDATSPIVGDMRYYQLNYDQTLLDGDKDVKTGISTTVLTTWFDANILLKSAFRLAKVQE